MSYLYYGAMVIEELLAIWKNVFDPFIDVVALENMTLFASLVGISSHIIPPGAGLAVDP